MEIREATTFDIPEIINVLRASIGESKLPKTEKIWRYKHYDNPFGSSLILVALDRSKIVGIRAFMRWVWELDGKKFAALRAVDTGVLPEYQRKGIFMKLNNKALAIAEKEGIHFIFNTPNSKSLPGNLKMGWKKVNKLKINFNPGNPFKRFKNRELLDVTISRRFSGNKILESFLNNYNNLQNLNKKLYTPKSISFLKWRYENNPLQTYTIIEDSDFYVAAYVKKHKYFNELRIAEHIYTDEISLKKIKFELLELNKKFGAEVITYSGNLNFKLIGFSGNFGPVLTFRNLILSSQCSEKLEALNNWNYTLGDLELF